MFFRQTDNLYKNWFALHSLMFGKSQYFELDRFAVVIGSRSQNHPRNSHQCRPISIATHLLVGPRLISVKFKR